MVETRRRSGSVTGDTKEPSSSEKAAATPQSKSRTKKIAVDNRALDMQPIVEEEEPPSSHVHGLENPSVEAGKASKPHITPTDENEDDDDAFLLGLTVSSWKKSIQEAIDSKKVNLKPATNEKGNESDEEKEEVEKEEAEADAIPGTSGPSANTSKSDKIMHWRPDVKASDVKLSSSASQRLVHQREIATVQEKDPSSRKELLVSSNDPSVLRRAARKAAPETAGKKWFDLPATKIDEEAKRELRLLRLRGAYDPKTFYKGFDTTKLPKFFQMGTVVDSPLDFYGGRLSNAERKGTLTEQLLADADVSHSRKKRYNKMQSEAERYSRPNKKRKVGAHVSQLPRIKKNVKHRER